MNLVITSFDFAFPDISRSINSIDLGFKVYDSPFELAIRYVVITRNNPSLIGFYPNYTDKLLYTNLLNRE